MHYVSSPAMNYSLKHRPKGHYFEYLVIVMTLCRKSFVLRFLYDIRSFWSAVFFLLCIDYYLPLHEVGVSTEQVMF